MYGGYGLKGTLSEWEKPVCDQGWIVGVSISTISDKVLRTDSSSVRFICNVSEGNISFI